MIKLKNKTSGAEEIMNINEVLDMVNADRTEKFIDYNHSDWRDGLSLTDYELVSVDNCICSCGNEHENEY